jgi:hypothetical protein
MYYICTSIVVVVMLVSLLLCWCRCCYVGVVVVMLVSLLLCWCRVGVDHHRVAIIVVPLLILKFEIYR